MSELDPAQQELIQNLSHWEGVYKTELVSVASLKKSVQNEGFKFTLPAMDESFIETSKIHSTFSEGAFEWGGRIDNSTGYVLFRETPLGTSGFVSLENGDNVHVFPITRDKSVLLYENPKEVGKGKVCGSGTPEEMPSDPCSEISPSCGMSNCQAEIRVLVLVEQTAIDEMLGTSASNPAMVNLLLSQALVLPFSVQVAFANSGINNVKIVPIVVPYLFQDDNGNSLYTPNATQMTDDLKKLEQSTTASQLIQQHEADMVLMLVGKKYPEDLGLVTPSVYQLPSNPKWSFGIIDIRTSLTRLVFAHELGHILGARHEKEQFSPTPCENHCNHGFYLLDPNARTIVTNSSGPRRPILHYSNPNISVNGFPTGDAKTAFNAGIISGSACIVANFFPYNFTNPNLLISYSGKVCDDRKFTLSSVFTPPPSALAPYTYEWLWSGGTLTGNSYQISVKPPTSSNFYVRLRITSANNQVFYSEPILVVHSSNCNTVNPLTGNSGNNLNISVQPNPTSSGFTTVNIQSPIDDNVTLILSNLKGIINRTTARITNGVLTYDIDTSTLPSGVYWLQANTTRSKADYKIIIANF